MLVVSIEILRLKERAILSNKGRKSTLAVALVCISIHNTWYIVIIWAVKIIEVSSLPHHYLLDEACQTLEAMPKIQVNLIYYIWLTPTFKIKSNDMFAMKADLCIYIQYTFTNDVLTPIFDWTVNALLSSCSRWVLLMLCSRTSLIRPFTGDVFIMGSR